MATRQAKIITVFNEKGGSGKTTLACQLAITLGRRKFKTMLADLDPQGTSRTWSVRGSQSDAAAEEDAAAVAAADPSKKKKLEKNFRAFLWEGSVYGNRVIHELSGQLGEYDFIIADCAPSVDQPATWGMLLVSDLALIPTKLSPPDLEALKAAKKLARRALEELGEEAKFPVRVVPNSVRKHMDEDQDYLNLLRADKEFPPLEETLGDRRAFQRSMIYGSSVHAVPGAKEAVAEIEALADRVQQLLGLGRTTLKKAVNS